MAESPSQTVDNTPKAAKDKSCPYCGQAFTSSSLGRHLDLYIKEKNPKAPDGIHDVDAIRKLRGAITRRQPRGSLARRRTSTPAGTPTAASHRSPASDDAESSTPRSPMVQKDGAQSATSATSKYPFTTPWEVTGVINDIPSQAGEPAKSSVGEGDGGLEVSRPQQQRAASRQVQKAQLDMKQKTQDAMDTARAAELALREIMGSLRAAK
jgi:hypothetical protein